MKVEFLVAFRYLKSKRREKFISITAIFSFIGIMLGVATLIVVMSVMNGFREEFVNKIIGLNSHITVFPKDYSKYDYENIIDIVKTVNNVNVVNPIVEKQVMFIGTDNTSLGGLVRGINIEDLKNKKDIYNSIEEEELEDFDNSSLIIIGNQLALTLKLNVGDTVKVIAPEFNNTVLGALPRIKTYTVGAIFSSGMYEYDSMIAFIPIYFAQKQFNLDNAITGIEIFLKNPNIAQQTLDEISNILENNDVSFSIIDWKGANSSLISALDIERNVMFLILTLIIIIAAFNIISSLIMLVMDKNKQIAIFKTIGASSKSIMSIFIICGTFIGFIGTMLGCVIGILFANNIENIKLFLEKTFNLDLFNPTVYFLSQLPSKVYVSNVVLVVSLSIILSFLATIYPAYKASKTDPAEILRYE